MGEWILVPREPTEAMILAAQEHNVDCGADMGDAYRAMIAVAPSPWQPIKTARKDGAHILLRYRYAHKDIYIAEGWWHLDGWYCHGHPGVRATHWMPLPTPPGCPE